MGSRLGRMLAITLPLAGIGIAAPFAAPALLGGAAAAGGAGGAAAGGAGAAAGGTAAATAPATIAATTPAITAPATTGAVAPAAAGGGAAAGGSITPAMAAQGVQAGTSLSSGLLNQAFNQPQMPTMPTIRAPVQSQAPMFSTDALPSVAGPGLSTFSPGPGPTPMQGIGPAGDLGMDVAANLFGPQNPFAQYAMAA